MNAAGSLSLTPDCAIKDIKQTDIIIVSAPGWDVLDILTKTHDAQFLLSDTNGGNNI